VDRHELLGGSRPAHPVPGLEVGTQGRLNIHIVHLSTAEAIPVIRDARQSGVSNLSVETCFHYLCLRAEDISPNATEFKCCPPVRNEANRLRLLSALLAGDIDFVVSDHSPCTPELKKGDFMSAWGGVSSLGLGLSLLWTEIGRHASLGQIVRWLGSTQAAQIGLKGRKGVLAAGADADFVVFDPDGLTSVTQDSLKFKNKISPYLDRELRGVILETWLRGQLVWDGQDVQGSKGLQV